jgi:hypothetical protein
MKTEFIALTTKLIAEQGIEVLNKPHQVEVFVAPYKNGEQARAGKLLLQLVQAGVPRGIRDAGSAGYAAYKTQTAQKLQNMFGVAPNAAVGCIGALHALMQNPSAAAHVPPQPVYIPVSAPVYQQPAQPVQQAQPVLQTKVRHGFVTFWLVLSIVLDVVYFCVLLNYGSSVIIQELCCFAEIIGSFLLLWWKKAGFYVSIIGGGIQVGFDFAYLNTVSLLIFNAINILLLYGVLHIKKNGKSCWEQLA